MAQNHYFLGAEIHAKLSEHQGEKEEDETWSVPSDHDDDDGDGEEEDEDGEGEQSNYPPCFYLMGNEEDDELSFAYSYGVIPMPMVGGLKENSTRSKYFTRNKLHGWRLNTTHYNATFSMSWWSHHRISGRLDA
ncbi:unnamed protein product [Linum trigynum]|uniref:Uncharacterized protein n=1 Tax=Linum trigynum TaxID=586398 RepID=A0AAV2GNF3_9ROSI